MWNMVLIIALIFAAWWICCQQFSFFLTSCQQFSSECELQFLVNQTLLRYANWLLNVDCDSWKYTGSDIILCILLWVKYHKKEVYWLHRKKEAGRRKFWHMSERTLLVTTIPFLLNYLKLSKPREDKRLDVLQTWVAYCYFWRAEHPPHFKIQIILHQKISVF